MITNFDPRNPTFMAIKEATSNGKCYARILIYGSSVKCRCKLSRSRAQIDFDLFSCNYDLRQEASDGLWNDYRKYCSIHRFRSRIHSHFGRTSIWIEVLRDHAEEWFLKVLKALQSPDAVTLCDAARELEHLFKQRADDLLLHALVELDNDANGDAVVSMLAPTWLEVMRLVQANPRILETMDDRRFEELIAGAYHRAGFDRVILTPRSGDGGVDVIAEKYGIGKIRIVDQAKRYRRGRVVTANDVRALGYVTLVDGASTIGVVTTTSRFGAKIANDRYLRDHLQNGRIVLIDGENLLDRLVRLFHGYSN